MQAFVIETKRGELMTAIWYEGVTIPEPKSMALSGACLFAGARLWTWRSPAQGGRQRTLQQVRLIPKLQVLGFASRVSSPHATRASSAADSVYVFCSCATSNALFSNMKSTEYEVRI